MCKYSRKKDFIIFLIVLNHKNNNQNKMNSNDNHQINLLFTTNSHFFRNSLKIHRNFFRMNLNQSLSSQTSQIKIPKKKKTNTKKMSINNLERKEIENNLQKVEILKTINYLPNNNQKITDKEEKEEKKEENKEEKFFCLICYDEKEIKESFTLSCHHKFCLLCLQSFLESNILEGKIEMKCFSYNNKETEDELGNNNNNNTTPTPNNDNNNNNDNDNENNSNNPKITNYQVCNLPITEEDIKKILTNV